MPASRDVNSRSQYDDSSFTSSTSLTSFTSYSHGDVLVRSQVIGFKKIKLFTNENVGDGHLQLPENEMHTTSYWITLKRPLLDSLPFSVSERQSGMFGLLYALESVATLLLMCDGRDLGTAIGERPPSTDNHARSLQSPLRATESGENIPTPCRDGAQHAARHQDGRAAAAPVADDEEFAPTRMADAIGSNAKEFFEPNLYLFDAYPGGIGFSEPLFRAHDLLVRQTQSLILACGCEQGCPSCVGPAGDLAPRAKEAALSILDRLCA